eukprot:1195668-Prorocentrum_minimum.AAC.8
MDKELYRGQTRNSREVVVGFVTFQVWAFRCVAAASDPSLGGDPHVKVPRDRRMPSHGDGAARLRIFCFL